jgi:putative PIN family toxin of toxin-antitoxin system
VRVVLDTNVLLSAIFTRGVCEALLDRCVDSDEVTIVLCEHILKEFAEHARGKFGAPEDKLDEAIAFLGRNSELVVPAPIESAVCPDQVDLPILGAAVAARAVALVTGDNALLALGAIDGIPILSPRQFYDRLG